MKRPMFCGALIACLCVVISFINIKTTLLCGVGLICFIVALAVNKAKAKSYFAVIMAFLVFISLLNTYKTIDKIDKFSGERIIETFTVTDIDEEDSYSYITVICNSGTVIPRNTKISILAHNNHGNFNMGDRFTASVKVKTLSKSENKAYYYSNGIYGTGDLGNVLEKHSESFFFKRAGIIKTYVKATIASSMKIENAATLLGITIGDKGLFGNEFSENIKITGVSHVMVVSGMHLTIILGAIFWLLDKIIYHSYIRFLISFAAIVLITSICGFTLSVIRAGIMFLLLSLAPVVKRDNDTLNSLGTAIIVILLFCPFAVLGVGFQLSALATFGIIYCVPFIESHLKTQNKFLKGIILSLSVTLSATIMTLPVTIYYFNYISLISPVTNILISYTVTASLCMSIIGLCLNLVPFFEIIAEFVFSASSFVVSYINYVINNLANVPFAAVKAGNIALVISLILAVGTVLFIYTCKYKENLLKSSYN